MGIFDVLIILIFIFGIYLGYQSGFIKQLNDLVILFIVSFIAGRLSNFLYGLLYKYFPFFNFIGKSEGIKSINIILWKLILYLLIIFIIMHIIKKVYVKTKLEDRLTNSILSASFISRILGAILSMPLMILLLFNIILVLMSPNFNLNSLNNSKLANTLIEKTPILAKENLNLYYNQKYIIDKLNEEEITKENYEAVNEDIIDNILKTKLISEDKMDTLRQQEKLLGTRKDKKTSSNKENCDDDESYEEDEENYDEDEPYEEDEENYEEDGPYEEDEENYEEDGPYEEDEENYEEDGPYEEDEENYDEDGPYEEDEDW